MTCTIGRDKLNEAMAAVVKVVGGKDFHPAWQCVRLQMVRGHLCIAATDGTLWLNLTHEASGEMEPVCVNAARLKDAVASLSAELVGLQVDGGTLRLFAGKGKRSLPIVAVDDFPTRDFEAANTFSTDAERLRDAVAFAGPHVADIGDIAKAYAAALFLFTRNGRLGAIGTDGGNMARIDLGEVTGQIEAAIPERVFDLAAALVFGDVELGLSERSVEVRWLGGRLLGPLLENPVPTERLIDLTDRHVAFKGAKQKPFSVRAEAGEITRALRGVRALGDTDSASKGKRVKLVLNGIATMSTTSPEGAAEEEVALDLSEARPLEIGFSSTRMERVLRGFGDRVLTMTMSDAGEPIKFEAAGLPDRVSLLFPMLV